MRITTDVLKANNACSDQISLFAATFPGGCNITLAVLRKARKAWLDVEWISRLLPPDARTAYWAARKPINDAYDAACNPVRDAYSAARDASFVEAWKMMEEPK